MRAELIETNQADGTSEEERGGVSATARERWEDEGGRAEPRAVAGPAPDRTRPPDPEPLPFPDLETGKIALKAMELVCLVNGRTLGRYRVQQAGLGERGPVFVVSLYGATCAKVEMMSGRKLTWRDYIMAMKRAIERELGYWQNRGEPLPLSVPRELEVTIRDTDFARS